MSVILTKNATSTIFWGVFILKYHPSLIHCEDCLIVEVTVLPMLDFQALSAIYLRTGTHGSNQIGMGR